MGGKTEASPGPTLSLFKNDPRIPINGVGRLPLEMTINSITVEPDFVYCAGGGLVDLTEWRPYKYGEVLPVVNVAVDPTINAGSPYLGRLDDSVLFNASDYYQASNNTFADITTEDFVFELVWKHSGTTYPRIINKLAASGWEVFGYGTGLYMRIDPGPAPYQVLTGNAGSQIAGAWYHGICFMDRSGYGVWYVNGAQATAADISAGAGSLTITQPFTVGASFVGSNNANQNVAYLAMWKRDAWLDTHLQAAVALERFNLLTGIHPYQARGTATPTVQTRASVAHLDKFDGEGNRKIYLMGSGALRLCERKDTNGKKIKGYLSEVQITNLQVRSEELDNAAWTKTRCSITNTSTTTLPNGDTSVNDVIHEDATAANNHPIKTTNSFVASTTYVWSAWFKAINRDWVYVAIIDGGGGHSAYFDISTGAVGNVGGLIDSGVEPWGNGWYRCWMSFTHSETADKLCYVFLAEDNGDITFDGLNQDSVYCWGVQLEAGVDYPTSYMPTAASSVIREEDSLRYQGDDGNIGGVGSNKAGEVSCDVLLPDVNNTVIGWLFDLTDGGVPTNSVRMNVSVGDVLHLESAATGESAGVTNGTTDICDGQVHSLATAYRPNAERIFVDGTQEGVADTDCGIPDDLDQIAIASTAAAALQLNGLISNLEFYERVLRKML